MKHDKPNAKMANGQQSQGIQNVSAIKVQITKQVSSIPGIFLTMLQPYSAKLGTDGCNNTIRCHHIGKAPPGRARAPGRARGHPPACRADRPANKAGPSSRKADRPANKAGPSSRKADRPNQNIHEQIASPLSLQREGSARLPSRQGVSLKTIFQINNQIVNKKNC